MGFSRQEYWSGLPFPSPGDLPDPGIEPRSPALQADSLPAEPPGKPSFRIKAETTWKWIYQGLWEVVLCFPFPTHTRYRPQPGPHAVTPVGSLNPAMPLLPRLQLSSFPISEQKSHRLLLISKIQFWLRAGSVSLTLTLVFCCFCYYNHTQWPASENPAPLPDLKLKCLGLTHREIIRPCLLWLTIRKKRLTHPPAWGLPF